jgi:HEAT repeat protein
MTKRQWVLAIVLGGGIATIAMVAGRQVVPLNEITFDHLPENDKESAIRDWGTTKSATAGRLLLHAAKDSSAHVRQAAAYELRSRCDLEDGMIALLDSGRGYSAGLMQALAECRSQKAIPIFLKYLKDLSHPGPAGVAAESIEKVGAREAIPQLKLAVQGCDELCKGIAAAALSSFGEREVSREWAIRKLSVPEAIRGNPNDTPDWEIRQYAVRVIGRIGTSADIPILKESMERRGILGEEADSAIAAIKERGGEK